MYIDYHIRYYL